ncbi:MAG: ferrochelatase [Gammaproteobacteria bacterium]|nr:ferrochelatase [Gammaproteobacteria bacterium]
MHAGNADGLKLYDDEPHDYDAVLVVSFGGPEGHDDVMPFLDNVFRGLRGVTDETKQKIAERYYRFGGVSPINAHTRAFIDALRQDLDSRGPSLPIYWGNRNWHPLLPDTLERMSRDGVRRAIAYVTSTFSSYSGCRKYREDLYEAVQRLPAAPATDRPPAIDRPLVIDRLRNGYNHPGFIEAVADRVREALERVVPERRAATPVVFTAHSLPESMARHAPYEAQLQDACRLVGDALEHQRWQLAYQSNNARYGGEPWLGPDIVQALADQKAEGAGDVVVAPIGFVCDHMEVVLDLDVDAAAAARELGIDMIRAGTVGTHPAFVGMVRDLIVERITASGTRRALGTLGPAHDFCPPDCCLSGRPGPVKPTIGEAREASSEHERTP